MFGKKTDSKFVKENIIFSNYKIDIYYESTASELKM